MSVSDGYIFDPVESDPDVLTQEAFDYLRDNWPDWLPSESNLETWFIGAASRIVSEATTTASEVPESIFRYYGNTVLGIPPVDPTPARVDSTWTLVDNPAGRTIAAGTLVAIPNADGDNLVFEVVNDVDIAIGVLTTDDGEVELVSQDVGEITSGIGGEGVVVDDLDALTWVDTITLSSITTGGQDGETDAAYLDRLSDWLVLLAPRPILPDDFAAFARFIALLNGVSIRSVALDGFNPADNTEDNERMVAVGVIDDETGQNVSGDLKTIIDTVLQAQREVNFVVNVLDPTRTPVDVTFTIVPLPGYDPDETAIAAAQAVTGYLHPANFGQPSVEGRRWVNTLEIRRQEISTVINNTAGVDYWETLTIGLDGAAQDTDEAFTLPGPIPVAEPGVIDGSAA